MDYGTEQDRLEEPGPEPVHHHGLPDSGDRTPQHGGAMRDRSPGKGRFDLLSPFFLQAMARLAEQGAAKYEHRNWERGYSTALCADSAMRHLTQYLAGDTSEDHLAAVAWNAMAAWHVTKMVDEGHLPADLVNHLPYFVNGNLPPCHARHPDYPLIRCGLDTGHPGPFHTYEDPEGKGVAWPTDREAEQEPFGDSVPATNTYCARCGGAEENHAPGGSRFGCDFAGPGTWDRCTACGHSVQWDGIAWMDASPADGGWNRYCGVSKDPDAAHTPSQAGDLR